jgi:predicted site-specific integrase-resolvase
MKEVADLFGVTAKTISRWIDGGKVDVVRKKNRSGHLRFTNDDLERLKEYANKLSIPVG